MINSVQRFNKKQYNDAMIKDVAKTLFFMVIIFAMGCIAFGG